jgi:gamma-glutamyltranspeptidase/glutathione hydrolase
VSGVVVCPQVAAAEAGVGILQRGGNAVDAAIATAFLQCVIDPPMAGLGGFGTMLHLPAGGVPEGIDFPARAGGRTRPDQWTALAGNGFDDRFGYSVEGFANDIGYQSVGVPGTVAGLGAAHDRWGSLPWPDLLAPAIAAAHDGFEITRSVHDFWMEPMAVGRAPGQLRMTATPAAAALFAPEGELLGVGEVCVQPELGRTLELLAAHGAGAFYAGEIADAIAVDFEHNGGHVTADDLASYEARPYEPLRSRYRRWSVFGTPPPSGGIMVSQMLHQLEPHDLRRLGHNSPDSIVLIVEAMRHAVASREQVGADPEFAAIDIDALLAPAGPPSHESPDTTQVTVVDRHGATVSLTHSLGYGSGVVTPGLGFLFNNYMNVFNPHPGHIDSVAPGKRRASSMAPTIVTDAELRPVLVAGAPGATRITTAVLHSILNVLDHGHSAVEAVSAPRFDCQGGPIELEGRIPSRVAAELESRGYAVNRRVVNYDPYFARAQVAVRNGDQWTGASDPRRDGGTALYE